MLLQSRKSDSYAFDYAKKLKPNVSKNCCNVNVENKIACASDSLAEELSSIGSQDAHASKIPFGTLLMARLTRTLQDLSQVTRACRVFKLR